MVYKGDAPKMLKELLKKNQETIVSLAYFDFDVYEPTSNVWSYLNLGL